MTSLNKWDKHRIVRAILDAIPIVDFEAEWQARVKVLCLDNLPVPIKDLYKTYPEYLASGSYYNCCLRAPTPGWHSNDDRINTILKADTQLDVLHSAHEAQTDSRNKVQRDLDLSFREIRTVKQFKERFPELDQYLPEAEQTPKNLPATTALIDSLRALGLPESPVAA